MRDDYPSPPVLSYQPTFVDPKYLWTNTDLSKHRVPWRARVFGRKIVMRAGGAELVGLVWRGHYYWTSFKGASSE